MIERKITNERKGVWVGIVAVIVVAALGLWWFSAGLPIDTWTPFTARSAATSTSETATTAPSATGASQVTRVSRSNSDIVAIVASLSGTSQFNALFKSTGVAATIGSGSGSKYTIFVPTNGAFAQLAGGTVANMSAEEKKRHVQYHIISGKAIDVDQLTSGSVESLSRDMLNFNYGSDKIPMVNSAIVVAEYTGKNGTVYLIDNVLLPPKKQGI